jgi:curved DNA-binding protein CbpA
MTKQILWCYQILELEPEASEEEARRAYRELVKVWHPDRFPHDPVLQKRANEKLKQLNEAYELVCEALRTGIKAGKAAARSRDNIRQQQKGSAEPSRNEAFNLVFEMVEYPHYNGYPTWPASDKYSTAVEQLTERFCVSLSQPADLPSLAGREVRGVADISERTIFLNQGRATTLTPVFLMAGVLIRDILILPGHQDLRNLCIRGLKEFGFENDGLFSGPTYRYAEKCMSYQIGIETENHLAKRQFSSWLKCVKANFTTSFSKEISREDIAKHFSAKLWADAPYRTRIGFDQAAQIRRR